MNLHLKQMPYPDRLKLSVSYRAFSALQKIAPRFAREIFTNLVYLLKLRKFVDHFGMGILEHFDNTISYVNPAFTKVFGFEPEEIIGKNIYTLIDEKQRPIVKHHIDTRSEELYETIGRSKQGHAFPVEFQGINLSKHRRLVYINNLTPQIANEISLQIYHDNPQYTGFSFATDTDLNINYLSFSADQVIYGYTQKELIGKNLKELLTKESFNKLQRFAPKSKLPLETENRPKTLEIKLQAKHGQLVDLQVAYIFYRNQNKTVSLIVGLAHDISIQKKLKNALTREQEHTEMFKPSKFTVDYAGTVTFHNEEAAAQMGEPMGSLVGRNYKEFTVAADIPMVNKEFNNIWKNKEKKYRSNLVNWRLKVKKEGLRKNIVTSDDFFGLTNDHELLYQHLIEAGYIDSKGFKTKLLKTCKTEPKLFQLSSNYHKYQKDILDMLLNSLKIVIIQAYVAKHYDHTNKKIGFSGILIDVTEKEKINYLLTKTEQEYRLLAERSLDMIWKIDLKTMKFSYISPSVEKLRGLSVKEAMAQDPFDSVAPSDVENLKKILAEAFANIEKGENPAEIKRNIQYGQLRKDGSSFPAEITVCFVCDKNGKPIEIQGTTHDITELKKVHDELAEQNRQLKEMEKEREKFTEQLKKRAWHDSLTKLNTRDYFFENMEKVVHQAIRNKNKIAIVAIDLNDLKLVNDTYGHEIGDNTLASFGRAMGGHLRINDLGGRLGGDEFLFVFTDIDGNINTLLNKIKDRLNKEVVLNSKDEKIFKGITASIGCFVYNPEEMPLSPINMAESNYNGLKFNLYQTRDKDIIVLREKIEVFNFNKNNDDYEKYLENNYLAIFNKEEELALIHQMMDRLKTVSDQLYLITDNILYKAKKYASEQPRDEYGRKITNYIIETSGDKNVLPILGELRNSYVDNE